LSNSIYIIWAAGLVSILILLAFLRSRYTVYICPKCSHRFKKNSFREMLLPQIMAQKLSKCPRCGKMVVAAVKSQSALESDDKTKSKDKNKNKSKNRQSRKN